MRSALWSSGSSSRPAAEEALATWLSTRGFTASDLQVRQARYDWIQLDAWYEQAWPAALSVQGAVLSDIDEGQNRLRFGGVDASAISAMAAAVAGGRPERRLRRRAGVTGRAGTDAAGSGPAGGRRLPDQLPQRRRREDREPHLHAGLQCDPRGAAARPEPLVHRQLPLHARRGRRGPGSDGLLSAASGPGRRSDREP